MKTLVYLGWLISYVVCPGSIHSTNKLDRTPLADLIPDDLYDQNGERRGVEKLMSVPNVEQFVQDMLPRLNIQKLSRCIGSGDFGVIFEADLKPKVAQTENPPQNETPAKKAQIFSSEVEVNHKRSMSEPTGKASISKPISKVSVTANKDNQALLSTVELKSPEAEKAVLKIVPDWIDFRNAPLDLRKLAEDFDNLQDKINYSQGEDYKYGVMKGSLKYHIDEIQNAINDLPPESHLRQLWISKAHLLDAMLEKGEMLPEDEKKSKEQLTPEELEAVSGIIEDVDSLALGSLESLASNEDDLKALRKIIHNADYVKLVLGQEYHMNEKEKDILTIVQANISQLPCERCAAYDKQNELATKARNIAEYSTILKEMSEYKVVCFAVMAMAEQDLSKPIKFLPDKYSNVKPNDLRFEQKTNDRFQKFMEIIKDILEGVFDIHLHGNSLHEDIKADNMLLYEEDGKLKVKINDFDNVREIRELDLYEFDLQKKGIDSISGFLKEEADRLIWMIEILFTLNQSEIGVHTIDDTELKVDGHEVLTEALPIRQLIIKHFQYFQLKLPGVIIVKKNWLTGDIIDSRPKSLLI